MVNHFKSKSFSFFIFIINILFFFGKVIIKKDILSLETEFINEKDKKTENINIKLGENDNLGVICSNYTEKNLINIKNNSVDSYYVLKDNKNMNCTVSGKIPKNFKLVVWTKGNKYLHTEFPVKYYYDNFTSFTIFEYNSDKNFTINGTLGDLINIGVLLFDNKSLSQANIKNIDEEILVLFVKNKMEKYCFKFVGILQDINYLLENENFNFKNIKLKIDKDITTYNSNIYCLSMNDNYNNSLFSFQYNNEKIEALKILHPLILGATYKLNMDKNKKIGLIPILSDNNFNYLTYQIVGKVGNYKSSIINCKNISTCNLTLNDQEIFNSSSITFTKNECGNFDNNKKVLFIECISAFCSINANIYTNNTNPYISTLMPFRKYLRKNKIDSFLINFNNLNNNNDYYYLYIETLSGDIDNLNINEENIKEQIDKKAILYKPKNESDIKIKADENIVYSIAAISFDNININESDLVTIMPNMNYRFKIYKNEIKVKLNYLNENIYNYNINYFLSFYSLNCKISIKENDSDKMDNIISINQTNYNNTFTVEKESEEKKDSENCIFDVAFFEWGDISNNSFYSIILSENKPHIYKFENDLQEIRYMYYVTDKTKDLKLNLMFSNITNYSISLFLNNSIEPENKYSKNETITIKSKNIKNQCKNETHACLIYFNIRLEEIKNDLTIEVKIYGKTNSSAFYIIGSFIGSGILLLIIIILIICICKNNNYFNKLKTEINTISFKDEEVSQNRESKDDDLLY